MDLNSYLKADGSPTVAEFRALLLAEGAVIKSDAQVRQWQHGYGGRLPDTMNCVAIEMATKGAVMRWDLRPDDWYRHWPELADRPGAPAIPLKAAA